MKTRWATWVVVGFLLPIAVVVVWWFASANSTSPFAPPLEVILRTFREEWIFAQFWSDVVPSLQRLFGGYLLALIVGLALGVLLGRHRALDSAFQPVIQFIRGIPGVALVPLGVVLLGIGDAPKIVLIALICVFPILLNTIDGVRNVDAQLEDVGQLFRLTRWQRLTAIQMPSAAPQIFAGMRTATSLAFIMMIVSEMVGATAGIGYQIVLAQQSFRAAEMWAGMILLALLGASLNGLFALAEKRILRWHYRMAER